jgi:hypothetical protein
LANKYTQARQEWKFLRALNDNPNVIGADGNVNNRTWRNTLKKVFPAMKKGHVFTNPDQYDATMAEVINTADVAGSDVMTEIVGNSGTATRSGGLGGIAIDAAASKLGPGIVRGATRAAQGAEGLAKAAPSLLPTRGAQAGLSPIEGIISGMLAQGLAEPGKQ